MTIARLASFVVLSTFLAACGAADLHPDAVPEHAAPASAIADARPAEAAKAPESRAPEPAKTPEPVAAASTAAPAPTETSTPATEPPPKADAPSLEGTLKSRQGSRVTVELPDGGAPEVGTKGKLFRRFSQDLGLFKASGWLAIAEVSVADVKGRRVVLSVDAETSQVTVNGRKVNHFQPGQPVRLEIAAR